VAPFSLRPNYCRATGRRRALAQGIDTSNLPQMGFRCIVRKLGPMGSRPVRRRWIDGWPVALRPARLKPVVWRGIGLVVNRSSQGPALAPSEGYSPAAALQCHPLTFGSWWSMAAGVSAGRRTIFVATTTSPFESEPLIQLGIWWRLIRTFLNVFLGPGVRNEQEVGGMGRNADKAHSAAATFLRQPFVKTLQMDGQPQQTNWPKSARPAAPSAR